MRRPSEDEIDHALDETFPASDPPTFAVGDDPPSLVPGADRNQISGGQLVRCPACGSTNRIAQDKLDGGLAARCGRCKSSLTEEVRPITVSDATFAELVERAALPVLLDLWAPWCGPCRMLAPVLDELATEMLGRVRFAKLNVDENPATAARFDARQIPLLVVLHHGREVDRIVGLVTKSALAARLQRVLAA